MDIGEPNWLSARKPGQTVSPEQDREALQTTPGTIIQHMVKGWLNPDFGKK